MDILKKITCMKQQRGWSNYRLAKEAGLPEGSLNNLFRLNHQPSMATLEAVCKGFGVSLSQFFADDDDLVVLSSEQKEIIEIYSTLNEHQKTALLQLMRAMIIRH